MPDGPLLPDGMYPFIDQMLPLADLAMIEAPLTLKSVLLEQSRANGIEIIRDEPVEIRCVTAEFGDAVFLIYWPTGEEMHMLAPRQFQHGLA